MPGTSTSSKHHAWYAWAGLAISTFAIMEHKGFEGEDGWTTLSFVLRKHVRRHPVATHAFAAASVTFGMWFAHHISYQALTEEGYSA